MRRAVRFLIGTVLGGGTLVAYLFTVGFDRVLQRLVALPAWTILLVGGLVVAEGLADSIGVWASVHPLGDGLSGFESVQFAMAGDFFDILSPAGPVSSEPIMAQFIGVCTETSYSEALGVRSVAKYVKAAAQLLVSILLGAVVVVFGTTPQSLLVSLGVGILGLLGVGLAVLFFREPISTLAVAVLAPIVSRISALYRDEPYDRSAIETAVTRFWIRVGQFRTTPGLLGLIAIGGVLEQVLTATALWVALLGSGDPVVWLPLVVIIPLPQIASVVPIPASLGAYDILLGGAIGLVTGVSPVVAAAAVLLVRSLTIPFGLTVGGFAVAFLRGWRP
ncbi:MAG: lysylphosphatidylglycerol synthase domain-containing protein [Halobacteriales archaeon]|nr:lysylphosphatidylglycerol synthase domain-containing protein [Halobacteriales archaeon]